MILRPPRSTQSRSSAASDVYKRQGIGGGIANTQTAIAVTVVVVLLLRWCLGRWYESWLLVTAIAGELLVFVAITATVHRARPAVERLDAAPPTSRTHARSVRGPAAAG